MQMLGNLTKVEPISDQNLEVIFTLAESFNSTRVSPGIPAKEGVCNDHGKCVCPNFFGFEKDKSKKCVWQESCSHCSKNAICENGKCSCVRGYKGNDFKIY